MVHEREDLEGELKNLRENVDECTITRVDLERKLISLRDELDFENLAHVEVRDCARCFPPNLNVVNFRSSMNSNLNLLPNTSASKWIATAPTLVTFCATYVHSTTLQPNEIARKRTPGTAQNWTTWTRKYHAMRIVSKMHNLSSVRLGIVSAVTRPKSNRFVQT